MRKSVLVRQVLPSLLGYALLVLAAIGADFLFHRIGLGWIGRYFGISGSVLIVGSFAYSLRKRKILHHGSPKALLDLHEILSWIGALMLLIHGGAHFNAVLPWAALVLMLVVVASGFTGKYLLKNARERLRAKEADLREAGLSETELAERLFLDSTTVDAMKKWRSVHIPVTIVFGTLAVLHVLSILVFWRW